MKKDYLRKTKKFLEAKLYSRNLIKGINTRAFSLIIYSGTFLKLTREEVKQIDQGTNDHAQGITLNVERLYVSKKERRCGLASVEDSLDVSIQQLVDYMVQRKTDHSHHIILTTQGTIERKTKKQKWEEKQFYGRFKRRVSDISHEKIWT